MMLNVVKTSLLLILQFFCDKQKNAKLKNCTVLYCTVKIGKLAKIYAAEIVLQVKALNLVTVVTVCCMCSVGLSAMLMMKTFTQLMVCLFNSANYLMLICYQYHACLLRS